MSRSRFTFRRAPLGLSRPRFLRPSLGQPRFLSADDLKLEALVVAPQGGLVRTELAAGFALTPVHRRELILPLETVSVSEAGGLSRDTPAGKAFPEDALSFFLIELAMAAPPAVGPGPRFSLFDLTHPLLDPARHALVHLKHSWERFRFWFVADSHVAVLWDRLQEDFDRIPGETGFVDPEGDLSLKRAFGGKSFRDSFVNPNRNLASLIRLANERTLRGELDFIVLGGDVVDYQLRSADDGSRRGRVQTNFDLFEDLVCGRREPDAELQAPLLIVPGNHDYRMFPYEIHHYGLDRCGLHDLQTSYYQRKVSGEPRRPLSPRDLRVVFGRGDRAHLLESYLSGINLDTDFAWKAGRTKFVFLDSGRDAFRNFLHVHPRRWTSFARAALSSWHFPSSAGLSEGQRRFLVRESEEEGLKSLVLVFHAGLINSHFGSELGSGATESRLPVKLKHGLRRPDRLGQRLRLEKDLLAAGLNYGGLFQNQLSLFNAGERSGRRVLGLSGHSHRDFEVRLDKTTGEVFHHDYCRERLDGGRFQDSSFYLAVDALGHVQARYRRAAWPGFYDIQVEDDEIRSVHRERLSAPPFDEVVLQARTIEATKASTTITVLSELRSPALRASAADLKMIVSLVVFAPRARGANPGFPFDIRVREGTRVHSVRQSWIPDDERLEYFGAREAAFAFRASCDFTPEVEFDLTRRAGYRGKSRVVVFAEYLCPAGDGLKTLRWAWHPRSIALGRA